MAMHQALNVVIRQWPPPRCRERPQDKNECGDLTHAEQPNDTDLSRQKTECVTEPNDDRIRDSPICAS